MTINQISAFIGNRPGSLAKLTRVLKEANINIRALYVADTSDYGILRMVVDDTDRAMDALREAHFTVNKTEVLAVSVADVPGGLHEVARICGENDINIEYLYAFVTSRSANEALVVIRTQDAVAAAQAIKPLGVKLLTKDDLI